MSCNSGNQIVIVPSGCLSNKEINLQCKSPMESVYYQFSMANRLSTTEMISTVCAEPANADVIIDQITFSGQVFKARISGGTMNTKTGIRFLVTTRSGEVREFDVTLPIAPAGIVENGYVGGYIIGNTGPAGPRGKEGEKGIQGVQGPKGLDGTRIIVNTVDPVLDDAKADIMWLNSVTGELFESVLGSDGAYCWNKLGSLKGKDGISPTLSIGTVDTLQSNQQSTVEIVSDESGKNTLNLGLVRGESYINDGTIDLNVKSINTSTILGDTNRTLQNIVDNSINITVISDVTSDNFIEKITNNKISDVVMEGELLSDEKIIDIANINDIQEGSIIKISVDSVPTTETDNFNQYGIKLRLWVPMVNGNTLISNGNTTSKTRQLVITIYYGDVLFLKNIGSFSMFGQSFPIYHANISRGDQILTDLSQYVVNDGTIDLNVKSITSDDGKIKTDGAGALSVDSFILTNSDPAKQYSLEYNNDGQLTMTAPSLTIMSADTNIGVYAKQTTFVCNVSMNKAVSWMSGGVDASGNMTTNSLTLGDSTRTDLVKVAGTQAWNITSKQPVWWDGTKWSNAVSTSKASDSFTYIGCGYLLLGRANSYVQPAWVAVYEGVLPPKTSAGNGYQYWDNTAAVWTSPNDGVLHLDYNLVFNDNSGTGVDGTIFQDHDELWVCVCKETAPVTWLPSSIIKHDLKPFSIQKTDNITVYKPSGILNGSLTYPVTAGDKLKIKVAWFPKKLFASSDWSQRIQISEGRFSFYVS